ncbi:MAG: putative cell division FtsK/SpoIIIE [Parcubacteria group bacterium Gr01-1014_72]|nr:MAG: putative cell division FtsK/SpoIIIE [Parcubacteria group bacterium Gr01-1014_72]
MAKKNSERKGWSIFADVSEEALRGTFIIAAVGLSALLMLAATGAAGVVGEKLYGGLRFLLGVGYFTLPLLSLMLAIAFWRNTRRLFPLSRIIGSLLFLASALGIIETIRPKSGGLVGRLIAHPLVALFEPYTASVILLALLASASLIILDKSINLDRGVTFLKKLLRWRGRVPGDNGEDEMEEEVTVSIATDAPPGDTDGNAENVRSEPQKAGGRGKPLEQQVAQAPSDDELSFLPRQRSVPLARLLETYTPPPLSLLERDSGRPEVGDIKAHANIIKRTLGNFGIHVEMDEVTIGPSVTRYALKPAQGVKLSRIIGLQNDLALALAAHPIRIEAPIPGKSLVGIEVPNTGKSIVGLGTLLGSPEYQSSDKPLILAIGKEISGKARFANLAKMPHLLIAGATGSGKSVSIHTIINSLLFRNPPNGLKLILIDPKRVELTLYKKIPHLLTPVITDAKKAILSLKWLTKEMERRYNILESEAVRDIESYHKNVVEVELQKLRKTGGSSEEERLPELMPYIVVVIDELADIMATYPRELETGIVRLAQMSRAVGIHLVLSTQRPSVDVITGLIKANIPARIALQVASQVDSRTILDMSGAEKLLGAGDMLFLSGEMTKPVRIQSGYVSETEVKKVVKHLASAYEGKVPDEIGFTGVGDAGGDGALFEQNMEDEEIDDALYEEAREMVVSAGKASTSYLQRRLRIGVLAFRRLPPRTGAYIHLSIRRIASKRITRRGGWHGKTRLPPEFEWQKNIHR